MEYYQQGDTLYFPIDEIPENAEPLKTNIVQEGESTGHAHRLYGDGFILFETKEKQKYLRVVKPTELKHEEHNMIKLEPGEYKVGIIKEYDHFTEEARQVAD